MAREISVTSGLQVSNGTSSRPNNQRTISVDQAAVGVGESTVAVTSTDTSVTLPLTTPGWCQLRNIGSTVVKWGPDNGSGAIAVAGEISPGCDAQFELPAGATTIRVKTASGTSTLAVLVLRK